MVDDSREAKENYQESVTWKVLQVLFQALSPLTPAEVADKTGLIKRNVWGSLALIQATPAIRSQLLIKKKGRSKSYWLMKKNETVDEMYAHYQKWVKEEGERKKKTPKVSGRKEGKPEIPKMVAKVGGIFAVGDSYNLAGDTVVKTGEMELSITFDFIIKRLS